MSLASARGGSDNKGLSSLSSTLTSTALAIFSAPSYVRYLQRKEIEGLFAAKLIWTKLADNRFKFEQQKVNSNSETRACDSVRCLELGSILPKSVNKEIMVVRE